MFSSGGTDRLVLLCANLAYVTALCGLLRGLSHLSNSFPTFCNHFSTVLALFESIVGELTPFLFIELFTSSFFWIMRMIISCNLFLIHMLFDFY
jgi:hypothetical protein